MGFSHSAFATWEYHTDIQQYAYKLPSPINYLGNTDSACSTIFVDTAFILSNGVMVEQNTMNGGWSNYNNQYLPVALNSDIYTLIQQNFGMWFQQADPMMGGSGYEANGFVDIGNGYYTYNNILRIFYGQYYNTLACSNSHSVTNQRYLEDQNLSTVGYPALYTNYLNSNLPYVDFDVSFTYNSLYWQNSNPEMAGLSVISNSIPPPPSETCTDGIQNQDEQGIDMGGVCQTVEFVLGQNGEYLSDYNDFGFRMSKIVSSSWRWHLQYSTDNTFATGVSDFYDSSYNSGNGYLNFYTFPDSILMGRTYYVKVLVEDIDNVVLAESSVISVIPKVGTVSIVPLGGINSTSGSSQVTGNGTNFTSTLTAGNTIEANGLTAIIVSIEDDTHMTITPTLGDFYNMPYSVKTTISSVPKACGTFALGCQIIESFKWLLVGNSTNTAIQFMNLRDQFNSHFPFSYIADFKLAITELFTIQEGQDINIQVVTGIGTITFLSKDMIESVPFLPLIRSILSLLIWFYTLLTIYRIVMNWHSATNFDSTVIQY